MADQLVTINHRTRSAGHFSRELLALRDSPEFVARRLVQAQQIMVDVVASIKYHLFAGNHRRRCISGVRLCERQAFLPQQISVDVKADHTVRPKICNDAFAIATRRTAGRIEGRMPFLQSFYDEWIAPENFTRVSVQANDSNRSRLFLIRR